MIAGLAYISWAAVLLGTFCVSLAVYLVVSRLRWLPAAAKPPSKETAQASSKTVRPPNVFRKWMDKRAKQKRMETAQEVFPQALEIAIQALKAGQTLPQTLEYLSQESAPPLKEEFSIVCREMAWGSSAEQALEHFAERIPSIDVARFLESYRLSRQTGANLAHLMQTLFTGMEERNRLARRMQSMTAQAKLSGILMGCLPFFMIIILSVMDPVLMAPLFTTGKGLAILAVAMFLEFVGFIWIKGLMVLEG